MTIRITDDMLRTISGGLAPDATTVWKIRQTIVAAGVEEPVELHRLEIQQIIEHRDRERLSRAGAERLLSLGPLPEHTCGPDPTTGVVTVNNNCPYGCRRDEPRIEVS